MMDLEELRDRAERRDRLWLLTAICVVTVCLLWLITTPPADASEGQQDFDSWYAQSHNAEWYHWQAWMNEDPRNRSWFAIRTHFGEGTLGDQAVHVAQCESELWPDAYNPSGASGVFQVMPVHAERFEQVTGAPYYDGRFDPDANTRYARHLYGEQGWGPWTCKP